MLQLAIRDEKTERECGAFLIVVEVSLLQMLHMMSHLGK